MGQEGKDSLDVVTGVEVIDSTFTVDFESVLIHLNVDGTPPDIIFRGLFEDDTLVLGRTTSLLSGEVDQGSRVGNDGSFVLDGIFVELSDRSVTLWVRNEKNVSLASCERRKKREERTLR